MNSTSNNFRLKFFYHAFGSAMGDLFIYGKRNKNTDSDSDYGLDVNYPKGALTKIMENNEWTFETLNWTYG